MKTLAAIVVATGIFTAMPLEARPLTDGMGRNAPSHLILAQTGSCERKCRQRHGDFQPCERGETRMCSVELGQCVRACKKK